MNESFQIPEHVHYQLGYGYEYQYYLSLLLKTIYEKKGVAFNRGKITKKFKNKTIKIIDKVYGIEHISIENSFHSLAWIYEKLLNKRDLVFLFEGENSYFEDLNIFSSNTQGLMIDMLQIKSTDDEKKDQWKEAVVNFLINKNLDNNIDFTFFVLTNKIHTGLPNNQCCGYIEEVKKDSLYSKILSKQKISKRSRTSFFEKLEKEIKEGGVVLDSTDINPNIYNIFQEHNLKTEDYSYFEKHALRYDKYFNDIYLINYLDIRFLHCCLLALLKSDREIAFRKDELIACTLKKTSMHPINIKTHLRKIFPAHTDNIYDLDFGKRKIGNICSQKVGFGDYISYGYRMAVTTFIKLKTRFLARFARSLSPRNLVFKSGKAKNAR